MHIEFVTRIGDPALYTGAYFFQYMSDEEVELYKRLLTGKFGEVFTEEMLQKKSEARIKP